MLIWASPRFLIFRLISFLVLSSTLQTRALLLRFQRMRLYITQYAARFSDFHDVGAGFVIRETSFALVSGKTVSKEKSL